MHAKAATHCKALLFLFTEKRLCSLYQWPSPMHGFINYEYNYCVKCLNSLLFFFKDSFAVTWHGQKVIVPFKDEVQKGEPNVLSLSTVVFYLT